MQPFAERHGLRGAMVAPTKIIAGLGLSLGLELLACPGATGDYRSDFGAKVKSWRQMLQFERCPGAASLPWSGWQLLLQLQRQGWQSAQKCNCDTRTAF